MSSSLFDSCAGDDPSYYYAITKYFDNRAYTYYTKEFRQSDRWRNKNLAKKLAFVLDDESDINNFIEYLIENNHE